MPRSFASSSTVLALAALLACTPAAQQPSGRPLEGTYWRLVELNGRPAVAAESGRGAYLQFVKDSARVVGSTGCNRLTGTYTHDAEVLRFGPAATTRMACLDPKLNDQESGFVKALNDTNRHLINGDTLTLIGTTGRLARFAADST